MHIANQNCEIFMKFLVILFSTKINFVILRKI